MKAKTYRKSLDTDRKLLRKMTKSLLLEVALSPDIEIAPAEAASAEEPMTQAAPPVRGKWFDMTALY